MGTLKKIAEGTSWISAGQVVDLGFGLLVTFLLVRLLSVADYGIYVLVLSVATFFAALSDIGTASLVISKVPGARTDADRRALLRGYRRFVLLISAGATLALFAFADQAALLLGIPEAALAIRIGSIAVLFQSLLTATQAVLVAFTHFKQTFRVTLMLELSRLVLIVLLIVGFGLGIEGAVLAYALSFLFAVLVGLFPVRAATRTLARGAASASFRALMHTEGKFAVGSHFLKQLRANAILWAIALIAGPTYVAYYAIAMSVLAVFVIPLSALEQTLYPLIASVRAASKRTASLMFAKAVKYGFLLSLLPAALLVLLAGPLIILVFTPTYAFSLFFYRVLAFEVILAGISVAIRPLLFALGKQRDIFFANLVQLATLFLFIALLLPIEPRLLTTAYVLASLIALIAYFAIVRANIRLPLRAFFTSDRIDREVQAKLVAKLRSLPGLRRPRERSAGAHR